MSEDPTPYQVTVVSAADVEPTPPGPIQEARALLESALLILTRIEGGRYPADRVDSVTWRLADVLKVLGAFAQATWPGSPTPGVTHPTHRGAKLDG